MRHVTWYFNRWIGQQTQRLLKVMMSNGTFQEVKFVVVMHGWGDAP